MFTLRKGRVGMLAAGSIVIAGLGATGASATGTPSPDSMVVRDGGHWYTQAYENTADGDYTVPEQSDVTGPQRAPFGTGSHKFAIGQFAVQTELYRTNDYDGVDLGDLTRLEYSTFARNTTAGGADRQPTYLRLNVDDDNDGARDTSLFFYPGNNGAVVNGEWQNWNVTEGLMNVNGDSGTGEISLADYASAHPDATLVNNRFDADHDGGAVSLMAGAAKTMTRGEYFVDRVIIGENHQDTLFDFGTDAETDGGTSQLTVDPDNAQGWRHQAYDAVNYLNSHQEFVAGTAPLGDGSLKMSLSTADNAGRVELFRTEQYDGTLVRDLRTLDYSTFQQGSDGNATPQQPAYLRLSVDNDGNGSTDASLFFFPANNGAVEQGTWQDWHAADGLWSIDGDQGPASALTLDQYAVAHPDAKIVKNEDVSTPAQIDGGVAFIVGGGGEGQMNGEYFLDAINISKVDAATGVVESGMEFDLEPTPASSTPEAITASLTGADNGAMTDKVQVNAPSAAEGATVRLYMRADGVRTLVETSTLNAIGNRTFKVDDTNGNRYTRYVAKVVRTEATMGDWTNSLRVR